jgi:hypothetical protein
MGHHFYIDDKEILYLGRSDEYDTLSPFKFCANDLFRLNNRIRNGETIKIKSEVDDTGRSTYLIKTTEEFETWVRKVFKGGFEEYLETGME